jgi:hypothetical protein
MKSELKILAASIIIVPLFGYLCYSTSPQQRLNRINAQNAEETRALQSYNADKLIREIKCSNAFRQAEQIIRMKILFNGIEEYCSSGNSLAEFDRFVAKPAYFVELTPLDKAKLTKLREQVSDAQ